jgi:hypothetical protein
MNPGKSGTGELLAAKELDAGPKRHDGYRVLSTALNSRASAAVFGFYDLIFSPRTTFKQTKTGPAP